MRSTETTPTLAAKRLESSQIAVYYSSRMATSRTSLYAILGVSRDADPVVIEAAYRALIRKFHPDRAAGDGAKAAEINFAYATLRDPQKRREYDEHLRLERDRASATFSPRTPPRVARWRVRPAAWIGLGAALAIVLALLVYRQEQRPLHVVADPPDVATEAPDAFVAADTVEARQPQQPISPSVIAQAVARLDQATAQGGFDEAARLSERCYRDQSRTRSFHQFVFCAAFDNAAAATAPGTESGGAGKAARFEETQVLRRQIDAANGWSDDAEWIGRTLNEIARLTFEAQYPSPNVENQTVALAPADRGKMSQDAPLAAGQSLSLMPPVQFGSSERRPAPPTRRPVSPAQARAAEQAVAAAAERWAKCAAMQFQANVRYASSMGAADRALSACTGQEQTTRALVRSALEARNGSVTTEEVEQNMDAARSTILGALN